MNKKTDVKRKIQIVGVGGLIINKKGEVLLTKRIEQTFPRWNGKWGIPGGHLEFGENPRQTLDRELREELGVKVKVFQKNPFVTSCIVKTPQAIYQGIFLCYLCTTVKGKPQKKSAEHINLRWFEPEKIDFKDTIPSTQDFINQYLEAKINF